MARVLFFICIAFTFAANADWLYWTTQGTQLAAINGCGVINYDAATVWATKNGETTKLGSYLEKGAGWSSETEKYDVVAADWAAGGGRAAVDISEYTTGGYSFYIEFYSWDASSHEFLVSGMSTPETYEGLAAKNYIGDPMSYDPQFGTWLGSGYMVPEPTGGVLLLMGLGLLGLRRRRNREVA